MTTNNDGDRVAIFATKHHNARDFESMIRVVTTALSAFGYGAVHVRVTDQEHVRQVRDILEDRGPQ